MGRVFLTILKTIFKFSLVLGVICLICITIFVSSVFKSCCELMQFTEDFIKMMETAKKENNDNNLKYVVFNEDKSTILEVPKKLNGDFKIPDGVTTIGDFAFRDCNITSVTFANSVTGIESWGFAGCKNLTSIDIPDKVTTIGPGAFAGCENLTRIDLPDSVEKIGFGAFANCNSLTDIKIPPKVTVIEWTLFSNCSKLSSINIPDGVTEIKEQAFIGCNNLKEVSIPKTCSYKENSFPEGCKVTIRD